ncbi:MAG: phosphotransferase family protein [Sterolibacterium sp.]|nr:phosphotransferase family protein [Sterolibacterium sp.]
MSSEKMKLEQRLQEYLTAHIPCAQDLVVERLEQILGGASRMTYFLGYRYRSDGDHYCRAVLRMMPGTGGFSSDNVAKEVRIFEALQGTPVPAPRTLFWSDESRWLGSPFVIMEQVEGCESSLKGFLQEPYLSVRRRIGENFWTMLGELAKLDPVALGLIEPESVPALEEVWRLELEYVEYHHRLSACFNKPVFEMLIRWLKKNPPPPATKLSIVHGDYRSGNFLYNAKGEIPLMMDWELWRLGDPAIDLVFSVLPNFQDAEGNAGRLMPVGDAIAIWEKTTGFKVSQTSWNWYEAAYYAIASSIWVRMRNEYFAGDGRESLTYFYTLVGLMAYVPHIRRILNLPPPSLKPLPDASHGNGERISNFLVLASKRYLGEYQQTIADKNTARTLAIDGLTLKVIADRFENTANNYVEENQEIEEVLGDARETFASGLLAAEIEAVLEEKPPSFRVSDLVRRNMKLCETLIALHIAVENGGSDTARRLEADIRQVISNQCERVVLPYSPFIGL